MTRISSLASNNELVRLMLQTQRRLQDSQIQVSTEKRSQDYIGIARDSERLIDLELRKSLLERFVDVNDLADAKLSATEANLDGIEGTVREFREALFNYEAGSLNDQSRVADVQEAAFRALKDIEAFLNADVFGEFVFAGGRSDRKPADLDLTSLTAFQTKYDGNIITYPTGRDNHIAQRLTATTGLPTNPTGAGYGTLTFAVGLPGTITAATVGSFANIPVGDTITIAGSVSNNSTFTVTANDGTIITVAEAIVAEGPTAVPTIAADTSYYSGDSLTKTHRTEATRDFTVNIIGIDPAFEKAIRAIGHIAQGVFGTAGGLDQVANQGRVVEALFLVNSALDPPPTQGTAPFGAEQSGNMQDVLQNLAFDRVLMNDTIARQKELLSFIEGRIVRAENVDQTEAVTRLLDLERNLEASFQSLARIRSLSLGDFLR